MTAPTLQPNQTVRHPRLQVDYVAQTDPSTLLQDAQVLAVFGFGDAAPRLDDPRYLRVPLQPYAADVLEVWRTDAPVRSGRDGNIAWSSDGRLQFGVIEIDEQEVEIEEAAAKAYAEITAFVSGSKTPRLLRIWNYLLSLIHI